MPRERISTTVDAKRLALARSLVAMRDADIFDRALDALIANIEAEREKDALTRFPYEGDAELALPDVVPGEGLSYEGEVPEEVLKLARQRRVTR